jgi:hypothetical protein
VTLDDAKVRRDHAQWHNLVLPVDDPFWTTRMPQNAYRCRCYVRQVSQREYDRGTTPTGKRMDKTAPPDDLREWTNPRTGETLMVPAGVHPAFVGNAGIDRAANLRRVTAEKLQAADPDLAKKARELIDKVEAPWRAQTAGTPEGEWHDQSFLRSPQWIKDAVGKRGALKGGVVSRKGSAHYMPGEDHINMGTLDKTRLTHQGVWRHEYGHAMDRRLQNGYFYRSAAPDFTEAMDQDARELIALGGHGPKNQKATKAALANLQTAYEESDKALKQSADRTKWLAERYAKKGLSFDQVQDAMKAQTDFATALQGIGLEARYARIITAVEQRDAQGLMDALTGKMWLGIPTNEVKETYKKGTLGCLSDLFGSATKNKVSGFEKSGHGHPDAYYKQSPVAANTECFANLTCFYGDESPVWGQIIDAMTPRMAQIFKEILK